MVVGGLCSYGTEQQHNSHGGPTTTSSLLANLPIRNLNVLSIIHEEEPRPVSRPEKPFFPLCCLVHKCGRWLAFRFCQHRTVHHSVAAEESTNQLFNMLFLVEQKAEGVQVCSSWVQTPK